MKLWIAAAVVVALGGSLSAQAPTATIPHHAADEGEASNTDIAVPGWLAGRWTASPFEVALSSDFHHSVYGPNARSVRQVTLTIRPSGDGTFTVTNSVRDRSGKTVPGTDTPEGRGSFWETLRPAAKPTARKAGLAPTA
jgi:hypothetical protein